MADSQTYNIQIKRYNGTDWDIINPKTTIANVSGLQSALDAKQATLTFDSTPTENSNNPVKSGGVYTSIKNVREVAEGKTKSYVTHLIPVSTEYKLVFASQAWSTPSTAITSSTSGVTFITIEKTSNSIEIPSGVTYLYALRYNGSAYYVTDSIQLSNLHVGDILNIVDLEYPDLWYGGTDSRDSKKYFYKMETSKVPLENYVPTSRTINGKALSSDITLSASDVSALPSNTTYVVDAGSNGNTLTITSSTGSSLTYTPTIPTNYLSNTPTSRNDDDSNTNYIIGKGTTGATGTNYYNLKVYFKGSDLYARNLNASNAVYLSSNSTPSADGLSNLNGDLYWKTSKVAVGNYIKSAGVSNNVLTLTKQDNSTTTFTNTTTYVGSSQPSNAHEGDLWYATA